MVNAAVGLTTPKLRSGTEFNIRGYFVSKPRYELPDVG